MPRGVHIHQVRNVHSRISAAVLASDWHRDHARRQPDMPFLRELARRHNLPLANVLAVAVSARPPARREDSLWSPGWTP
jgi:hypothetical protein